MEAAILKTLNTVIVSETFVQVLNCDTTAFLQECFIHLCTIPKF